MKKILLLLLVSTSVIAQEQFTYSFNMVDLVSTDGVQEFKMNNKFTFNYEGKKLLEWDTNGMKSYLEYIDLKEVIDNNGIRYLQIFLSDKEADEELELRLFHDREMGLAVRRTDANTWAHYYE